MIAESNYNRKAHIFSFYLKFSKHLAFFTSVLYNKEVYGAYYAIALKIKIIGNLFF